MNNHLRNVSGVITCLSTGMPLVDYNYNDDWLILDGFRLWSMQIDRKHIICFYLTYVNDGICPVTLSKAQIIAAFVDFVHWDVMILW